jgi:hypothetical protein
MLFRLRQVSGRPVEENGIRQSQQQERAEQNAHSWRRLQPAESHVVPAAGSTARLSAIIWKIHLIPMGRVMP